MIKGNSIQLSAHFTYKKMFRFVLAPICTMLFTSIYGIVDGFFVSNYVGNTAFASLNLVMPYIMMVASIGFMFGSGVVIAIEGFSFFNFQIDTPLPDKLIHMIYFAFIRIDGRQNKKTFHRNGICIFIKF